MLDAFAPFRFHGGKIVVPLDEYDVWHYLDLDQYHLNRVRKNAATADRMMPAFDFIDCGCAHLGLFSAQFSKQSRQPAASIVAFEPNRTLFRFLENNIRAGWLRPRHRAAGRTSPTSGARGNSAPRITRSHLEPGAVHRPARRRHRGHDMTGVAARVGPAVALKLDIEGTELEVLRGGKDFIRSLRQVVICLEFHRKVLARIGRTDVGMLAEIETIRKLRWVDASVPPGDRSTPFGLGTDQYLPAMRSDRLRGWLNRRLSVHPCRSCVFPAVPNSSASPSPSTSTERHNNLSVAFGVPMPAPATRWPRCGVSSRHGQTRPSS